jgi:purine-binding chemotaxis protein CheW
MASRLTGTTILEQGDERYGLIVDLVENIINIAGSDRRPSPRLGSNTSVARAQAAEVIDCVCDPDAFIALVGARM